MAEDTVTDDAQREIAALGAALRAERRRHDLSLKALSERSGVAFGLISELERGLGNPGFVALHRLARALDVDLLRLLAGEDADDMVVRADGRRRLPEADLPGPQPVRELLTPRTQAHLQVIRSTLPPGFSNEGRPYRHLATESVVVESGRLRVVHGSRDVELGPGDAMTYGCSTPHWWANAHDDVTVVLGSVTPLEA